MASLVPMPAARTVQVRVRTEAEFTAHLAREKGVPAEELLPRAQAHADKLLALDGNRFLDIVADGEVVGWIWIGVRNGPVPDSVFVFDLFVEEEHRGHGHGHAAMTALEPYARDLGVRCIALSVFAHNTGAIRLYERLGYDVILEDTGGQRMAKKL